MPHQLEVPDAQLNPTYRVQHSAMQCNAMCCDVFVILQEISKVYKRISFPLVCVSIQRYNYDSPCQQVRTIIQSICDFPRYTAPGSILTNMFTSVQSSQSNQSNLSLHLHYHQNNNSKRRKMGGCGCSNSGTCNCGPSCQCEGCPVCIAYF